MIYFKMEEVKSCPFISMPVVHMFGVKDTAYVQSGSSSHLLEGQYSVFLLGIVSKYTYKVWAPGR